jgi:hypothetical protein
MSLTLRCVGLLLCVMLGCGDDAGPGEPAVTGPDGGGGVVSERASIVDGDAVFFVGNSYFMSWSRVLPDWVTAVGRAVQPPVAIKTGSYIVPGSNHLSWFFARPESKQAIASGQFKVFVIQGDEQEPVNDPEGFKQAVRDYHQAITASGAKMMLFMTWNLHLGTDFYGKLKATFDEIGSELNLPIIPAGQVYDDCERDPFPGYNANTSWLTYEDLHQNEIGSAVNAYATFGMLTGIDPMGVQFDAPANTNSAQLLKYLSDKTWARVEPRLP